MYFSAVPFANTLLKLRKTTLRPISNYQLILSQVPFIYPIWVNKSPIFRLQFWEATDIILIFLSDREGHIQEIQGPKNDFALVLTFLGYRHDEDNRNITLIHDFDVTFTDVNQVQKEMRSTPSSKDDIKSAIQKAMQSVGPRSKVFFYFGGHGDVWPEAPINPSAEGQINNAGPSPDTQNIIAGDGKRISGVELRSLFCAAPHPSVAIITVFDTCCSGGSLGLPYTYDIDKGSVKPRSSSHHEVPLPMLQISACRARGIARSVVSEEKTYGTLSWVLACYLKENNHTSIEGLVEYLYGNCGEQQPQVCCSLELTGRIRLF